MLALFRLKWNLMEFGDFVFKCDGFNFDHHEMEGTSNKPTGLDRQVKAGPTINSTRIIFI